MTFNIEVCHGDGIY